MARLYRAPSIPAEGTPEHESGRFDPSNQTGDEVNQYLATASPEERDRVLKAEKGSRKRASVLEGPHGSKDQAVGSGAVIPTGSNSPVLSAGGSVDGADSASQSGPAGPVVPLPGDTTIPASGDDKAAKAAEAEQAKADKAAEKDAKADAEATAARDAEAAKAEKAAADQRAREAGTRTRREIK
jgi:hypothetical protein